jgi:hypothetical protein
MPILNRHFTIRKNEFKHILRHIRLDNSRRWRRGRPASIRNVLMRAFISTRYRDGRITMMNDVNDEFHENERKRLGLTWDQYWLKLAAERVGSEDQQIEDVLNQLRSGSAENRIRADTIERRLAAVHPHALPMLTTEHRLAMLELTTNIARLYGAILMVPDGWMYSIGLMNTAKRTGYTAFLWTPNLVVKDGKVEPRAVSGEGDTLADALLDAIGKAVKLIQAA